MKKIFTHVSTDESVHYDRTDEQTSMLGLLVIFAISCISMYIPNFIIALFDKGNLYNKPLLSNQC